MPGSPIGGTISADQPVITRDNTPRLASVDARATPSDFGSAQGLDELSRGLEETGTNFQDMSDKRDALWAQQITAQAEVAWKQNLAQAQQQFTLDPSKGTNYVDTFKSQFNDYQQSILDNNPNITQNAKNLVMTHLNEVGASMFGDALNLQAKATTDWSVQSFQATSDNIKTVANAPDATVKVNSDGSITSSFDDARNSLTKLYATSNGVVPTAMIRDRLLQDHVEIDKAEIDTSTQQNGAGVTAKLISDGKLGTSLTIPQRQEQILELQRQEQENTTSNIRDYVDLSKKYSTQVQITGQRDPAIEKQIALASNKAFGSFGPFYAAEAGKTAQSDEDKFDAQKQLDQIQAQMDNKYPTKEAKDAFLKSLSDPNHVTTPQEESDSFYLNYLPHIREGENPIDSLDRVKQFQANFSQQVQDSVKVSQAAENLKSLSLSDLTDTRDALRDTAQTDPINARLLPMADARIAAIKNDPFSVTAQDDKGVARMLGMAQTTGQGQNPTLAKMLGGNAPTDQDRANGYYQNAVDRSISLQQRLNPNADPMVMSKPDADDLISQIKGAKSSTDLSQILSGMQQKFGSHFNQAIAQLHNNPNNPLPSGMGVVTANMNEPNAKDIMQAQLVPDGKGQGKEQDKEGNPGYTALFTEKGKAPVEKAIDTAIQSDPTLANYADAAAAIDNSKSSMDMINGTRNAVAKYAKFLYLNPPPGSTYGDDGKDVVAAAVASTVGKHVDFGSTNGVTYLISREGPNGQHYSDADTAKIKAQLDREKDSISDNFKPNDLDTQVTGDNPLDTPGKVALDSASKWDVESRSYWVTKSDSSGVSLFVKPVDGESLSRAAIPIPNSFRSFSDMLNKGNTYKPQVSNSEVPAVP